MPPDVSAVVPVYRNEETLEELHARLAAALSPRTFEIVFVDDASPDGSLATLRRLEREDPRVKVLALPRNGGQHRAVLAGLARAEGRRAVLLDADLQDPPEAVPLLLDALGDSPGAVFGGRRGRYESAGKLLTSRLFKAALHLLARIPRDAGMFVAMGRPLVDRLLAFHDPEPFVPALIGAARLPLRSIPVERAVRPRGRSAYTSRRRLAVGVRALVHAARRRREVPR